MRARFLEAALLANAAVHAVALPAMALCLLPGIPGGPTADAGERAAYVAAHPGLWRLGWLPWHLCALADVVLGVALVATRWLPKLPAWLALAFTLAAVVPEQTAEFWWVTRGVALAADDPASYAEGEAWAMRQTSVVAASLYVGMALMWTWCLVGAGVWSRALTWLSVAAWGSLAVASLGLLLPEAMRPNEMIVAACTGAGFPLLVAWLALAWWRVRGRAASVREEP